MGYGITNSGHLSHFKIPGIPGKAFLLGVSICLSFSLKGSKVLRK